MVSWTTLSRRRTLRYKGVPRVPPGEGTPPCVARTNSTLMCKPATHTSPAQAMIVTTLTEPPLVTALLPRSPGQLHVHTNARACFPHLSRSQARCAHVQIACHSTRTDHSRVYQSRVHHARVQTRQRGSPTTTDACAESRGHLLLGVVDTLLTCLTSAPRLLWPHKTAGLVVAVTYS